MYVYVYSIEKKEMKRGKKAVEPRRKKANETLIKKSKLHLLAKVEYAHASADGVTKEHKKDGYSTFN